MSYTSNVECSRPPLGYRCTREPGHEGPCAAVQQCGAPTLTRDDQGFVTMHWPDDTITATPIARELLEQMIDERNEMARKLRVSQALPCPPAPPTAVDDDDDVEALPLIPETRIVPSSVERFTWLGSLRIRIRNWIGSIGTIR